MSFRLFTALSLLLVPLSGCIAGVGTMSAESGLSTATDHVEDLLDTNVTPTLVGVASIEPFQHYLEKDGDYEFEVNTYADSEQGDGKIPAWAYAYCSGDDLVIVFLASGIGVLADVRESDDCEDDFASEAAIVDWKIDSDEAADILADHDDWPEPREDSVTSWVLTAMQDENGTFPAWLVETDTLDWDDKEHYAAAIIDATTGEIVEISDEYPDYGGDIYFAEVDSSQDCIEAQVDDSDSGIISAVDGMIISIDLPAEGYLQLTLQSTNTITSPTYTLEGPDGEVDSGTVTSYSIRGVEDVPAGQYTLSLDSETADQVSMVLEGFYCS